MALSESESLYPMPRALAPGTILKYPGGKNTLAPLLLQLTQIPCQTYVEPFAGSAALFFRRQRALREVLSDKDPDLIHLYTCLQNPCLFRALYRRWAHTPYSRAEYARALSLLKQADSTPLDRAWAYLLLFNSSIGNFSSSMAFYLSSWACTFQTESRNPLNFPKRALLLFYAHHRLQNVNLLCQDALEVIPAYDSPQTLFYLDPPYLPQTRKGPLYRYEVNDDFYQKLIPLLLRLQGHAVLSGYEDPLYHPLLEAGWKKIECPQYCRVAVKKRGQNPTKNAPTWGRTECLWVKCNGF